MTKNTPAPDMPDGGSANSQVDDIHVTQSSFAPDDLPDAEDPASDSARSPGPEPVLVERLTALEAEVAEMAARVRLLEKHKGNGRGLSQWSIALLCFVLLAMTWRLFFGAH